MSPAESARNALEALRTFSCYQPEVFSKDPDEIISLPDFMDYLDAYVGVDAQEDSKTGIDNLEPLDGDETEEYF